MTYLGAFQLLILLADPLPMLSIQTRISVTMCLSDDRTVERHKLLEIPKLFLNRSFLRVCGDSGRLEHSTWLVQQLLLLLPIMLLLGLGIEGFLEDLESFLAVLVLVSRSRFLERD